VSETTDKTEKAIMTAPRSGAAIVLLAAFALLYGGAGLLAPSPAYGGCDGSCVQTEHQENEDTITEQHEETREHMTEEMKDHQLWFTSDFFTNVVQRGLRDMANEMSAIAMRQTQTVGILMDAGLQVEQQRLLRGLEARAHKEYSPSASMCVFGTATESIAASQRKAELTQAVLATHALNRQTGHRGTSAENGKSRDRLNRLQSFRKHYCDDRMNSGMTQGGRICETSGASKNINKDINFVDAIDSRKTLNINFDDDAVTDDETNVITLGNYLFGHDVFDSISSEVLNDTNSMDEIIDMRGVLAKRSVARNSYDAIVGLKSAGGQAADMVLPRLASILKTLGLSEEDANLYLIGYKDTNGDSSGSFAHGPSYYAQLDILAQKIYQSPSFYIDLYDKPANVDRKNVAMQAIGLMLDREAYKSELRSESVISVLLEMEVMGLQDDVRNRLNALNEQDEVAEE